MAQKYIQQDPYASSIPEWGTVDLPDQQEDIHIPTATEQFEDIAGAGYTGVWNAFNEVGLGLPSLAEAATIGNTGWGRKLKDIRKGHPTAATVGKITGDVGAFLIPAAGAWKALTLPAQITKAAGARVATSELVTRYLSPTATKYAAGIAEGSTAAALASTASGIDDMDLNGFSMDSAKSHAIGTATDMLFGAGLGAAFTGVGQTYKGIKNWRANKATSAISQDGKDGLQTAFDLAVQDAETTEAKSTIKDNWNVVERAIKEFEEDAKTTEGQLSERFKKNEMVLDMFIGHPEFMNRSLHKNNPLSINEIIGGADQVDAIKTSLGKELGIPTDMVNVRSELTQKMYKHVQKISETEGRLIGIRKNLTNNMAKSFDQNATPKSGAQWEAYQTALTNAESDIESIGTAEGSLERALSSNRIASKSQYDKIVRSLDNYSPTEKSALQEAYASQERGPSEASFNKYKKDLMDVISRSRPGDQLNSGEVYQRLNNSIDEVNSIYGEMEQEAKQGRMKIPEQYTTLYKKLHSRLTGVARDEKLWGDAGVAHSELNQIVNKKMNLKNSFMRLIGQQKKMKISKGVKYEKGVADIIPSKSTDFDPKAFSKLKMMGMGNGNIEHRMFSRDFLGGYMNNTQKETEIMTDWVGSRIADLGEQLDVQIPNRVTEVEAQIEELRALQLNPETAASQRAIGSGKEIEELQKELQYLKEVAPSELTSERNQLLADQKYLRDTNASIAYDRGVVEDTADKLDMYNSRRVSNWFNFWDNAEKLKAKPFGQGEEQTFHFHSGANNPQLELMRLGRDSFTGYTRGVDLALTQLGFWGIAKGANTIMKHMGHNYSPERAFLNSKYSFLRANQKMQQSVRGARVLKSRGKKSELGIRTLGTSASVTSSSNGG